MSVYVDELFLNCKTCGIEINVFRLYPFHYPKYSQTIQRNIGDLPGSNSHSSKELSGWPWATAK